ncbi:cell division protein, partial [Kocuria subflava]|nr:cell division protein [Kocuria subflava]
GPVPTDPPAQPTPEEPAPAVETEEEVAQPIVAEDAAGAAGEPVDRATAPGAGDAQSAAGVLVMAQRLHDEYVAKGQAEHDRLTADGQSEYDRLLSEAQRSKDEVLTSLESERGALQEKVDHLRGFEQTYRVKLKEFISGQLNDIDAAPPVEDDVAAIVGELPADEPQVQGATD